MKRVSGVCVSAGLVIAVLAAAVFAAGGVASSYGTAATSKVTVAASEFKFALSRRSVRAGTVTFVLSNKGKIPHDFKIAGKKTPVLKRGKSATLRIRFSKGRYRYLCTVPGHAAAGMKGVLAVTS